jgi:hypothetical protein
LADHATFAVARNLPVNLKELVPRTNRDVPIDWRNVSPLAQGNRAQLNLMEKARARLQTNLQLRIGSRRAWRLNRDPRFNSKYLYIEAFRCLF